MLPTNRERERERENDYGWKTYTEFMKHLLSWLCRIRKLSFALSSLSFPLSIWFLSPILFILLALWTLTFFLRWSLSFFSVLSYVPFKKWKRKHDKNQKSSKNRNPWTISSKTYDYLSLSRHEGKKKIVTNMILWIDEGKKRKPKNLAQKYQTVS